MPLRTRIAPTPSGFLHAGNLFSFLLTAAIAQQHNAELWLRIDDMDTTRTRDEYLKDILDVLRFLDLPIVQLPESTQQITEKLAQKHNLDRYKKAFEKLKQQEKVYACHCSRKSMPRHTSKHTCRQHTLSAEHEIAWRAALEDHASMSFRDEWMGKQNVLLAQEMPDFIVWRKDDIPAYQLTSICDDETMGISIIVRGADLLASTAAQCWLDKHLSFGFRKNIFYHHPLIFSDAGEKLSKSEGAFSVRQLMQEKANKNEFLQAFSENIFSKQKHLIASPAMALFKNYIQHICV